MFKEISGRDLFIIEGGKKNPVWKFFEGTGYFVIGVWSLLGDELKNKERLK